MRVHHLDAARLNPRFPVAVCAHVLLVEHPTGLVLVDSGLGRHDHSHPERMGPARFVMRPDPDDATTAVAQVEALGYTAADVTDVVMTHLDFDHVGGIADFPGARVHTTADEHAAAITAPDWQDKYRYRRQQMPADTTWVIHAGRGDEWRAGLTGHEILSGITLVPMPGHSRGHAAVAVDAGDRGLLVHAGDAAFDAGSYADRSPAGEPLETVRVIRTFEQVVGRDRKAIARNHVSLRRLNDEPDVTVFPAHDPRILRDLQASVN